MPNCLSQFLKIYCLCNLMLADGGKKKLSQSQKQKKMSCLLCLIVLSNFFLIIRRQLFYLATFNVRNVICILIDFKLNFVFRFVCSKFTCPTITFSIKCNVECLKLQIVYGTKEHEYVKMQLKGDFNNSIAS